MSAAVIAFGALSALGEGAEAASAGVLGEHARVGIGTDEELVHAELARPLVARVALLPGVEDRAAYILAGALTQCAEALDAKRPGWRALRVGLALGTSSGGMRSAEHLFDTLARGDAIDAEKVERAHYAGPMLQVTRAFGMMFAPASLVLAACASSAIAIGLAARWLEQDACDLVLAGGFDAVSVFVAAGFESLRATSERVPPRPFRVGRDGMALGEGAAILALVRSDAADEAMGYVAGFGAAADAVHLTAPDRTGSGLARAASSAIADAGVDAASIDLVSAHATATPFNDPAEARALAQVLGTRATDVPVHPFKAQIGHTLGAAAALESLACFDAFARRLVPAAAGEGPLDPDAPALLLSRTTRGEPRVALKLGAAFGGANAALVLTRDRPSPQPRRVHSAYVSRAVFATAPSVAELAQRTGYAADRLARADAQVLHAIAAIADLVDTEGPLDGAGVIVGTAIATIETNARFQAKIRERGARFAEPRRFPYTSPNAVAGECGIVFRLTGPAFSVGLGLHAGLEALAAAAALVRSGDAERIVVVAVDDVADAATACVSQGALPALKPGAVALVVSRSPSRAVARVASTSLLLGARALESMPNPGAYGHAALLPLTQESPPSRLHAVSKIALGPAATATVILESLDA